MHRHGIHDIVQLHQHHGHAPALVDKAGDCTDDHGLPTLHCSAASCNAHQAREKSIAKAWNIQCFRCNSKAAQEEDHQSANARSKSGVGCDQACAGCVSHRMHCEGAAWVEAIPTKPEEEGADDAERHVVWVELVLRGVWLEATLAWTDDDGSAEGCHAAHHVHQATAGEVHVAWAKCGISLSRVQEALATPAPVDHNGVNNAGHDKDEETEGGELGPLSNGTAHNR
mmetsp:Transcript_41203/g.96737  ORF Transcript_41203/g.96737 Transcript_41203/m.96737 type:complete len:227 (-) Transcript_41203:450-1130(-)